MGARQSSRVASAQQRVGLNKAIGAFTKCSQPSAAHRLQSSGSDDVRGQEPPSQLGTAEQQQKVAPTQAHDHRAVEPAPAPSTPASNKWLDAIFATKPAAHHGRLLFRSNSEEELRGLLAPRRRFKAAGRRVNTALVFQRSSAAAGPPESKEREPSGGRDAGITRTTSEEAPAPTGAAPRHQGPAPQKAPPKQKRPRSLVRSLTRMLSIKVTVEDVDLRPVAGAGRPSLGGEGDLTRVRSW